MRSLPIHIRNGFVLANAVRIASISQPDNLELFGLKEAIKVDDFITSFILRACLFNEYKMDFEGSITSCDVAVFIYEQLKKLLNKNLILSRCANESPVDCTECNHKYRCCKQRKLMFAMVEKNLEWLKEHRDELQDIDHSDNVDLAITHNFVELHHFPKPHFDRRRNLPVRKTPTTKISS